MYFDILLSVIFLWLGQHALWTQAECPPPCQCTVTGIAYADSSSSPCMELLSPVTVNFVSVLDLKSFCPLVYFPMNCLRKIITNIPSFLEVLSQHSKRLHGKSITGVWISSPVSGKFVAVIVYKYFENYFKHFGCLGLALGFDSFWAVFSLGVALLFILKLSFLLYLDKEISMIPDKENIVNQTGHKCLNNILKNVSILFSSTASDFKLFKHGHWRVLQNCDLMTIMTHFNETVSFWVELIHLQQ